MLPAAGYSEEKRIELNCSETMSAMGRWKLFGQGVSTIRIRSTRDFWH